MTPSCPLPRSTTWLRDLAAASPDALLVVGADGTILEANEHAGALFGWACDELRGRDVNELVPLAARAAHADAMRVYHGAPHRRRMGSGLELAARRRDGSELSVDIALAPLDTESGRVVVASVRDMTAVRASERALRQAEQRIRTVMELAHVGTWEHDVAKGTRSYSPELLAMLGLPESHATSEAFFAAVHPEDRPAVAAASRRALEEAAPYDLRMRVRHADGTWRWFETRAFPDLSGPTPHLRGLVMDVTERVASELEAERRERELRVLLDTLPSAVALVDARGHIAYANRRFDGGPVEEILGTPFVERVAPELRPTLARQLEQARATDAKLDSEHWTSLGGPELRCIALRLRRLTDDSGRVLAVAKDVTAERRAAAQLDELRQAMENAVEGIARVDASGRHLSVNAAYARMHGRTPEELLGREALSLFVPEDAEVAGEARLRMLATGRSEVELTAERPDGSRLPVVAVLVRACAPTAGWFCFLRDASEQHRTREQLVVSDRLASLGLLAAGVAHEINNPLAAILGNLELLELRLAGAAPGVPGLAEPLKDARTAAARVRQVVRDLHVFARAEERLLGPVDIRQVLDTTVRLAECETRHRARVRCDYAGGSLVQGDEARLGQVFLNLIVNAAQAIEAGDPDGNEIRVATRAVPPDRLAVEVSDTGRGIARADRARLFSPFFTTKPPGVGLGLGLAISHRIVSSLGGQIEVESEPGRGTTFRVLLQAAAPPRDGAVPP
ncbi:MAG: PAS domain S-box protein [Polyangiaceae bacterium]|nr:PAS domain S-box protein [Polyangiaceae bacterium]